MTTELRPPKRVRSIAVRKAKTKLLPAVSILNAMPVMSPVQPVTSKANFVASKPVMPENPSM